MGQSAGTAAEEAGTKNIDELCINTIRTLAMDAVQKAQSGHPGAPMALAPLAYVLWTRFLRYNPRNPKWFNRDRFVLSNGHASMLQYAVLHLAGYDVTVDDIKSFRQWGSKTPGHPEHARTAGIETTTGPLGQGIMNAVGMAMAQAHLAAVFNRPGHEIVDHYTYAFMSDGDLMEGASHEAASLAGHFGLGKLICVYDDNHISIEGPTELTYTDDAAKRFEAYHWHVENLGDRANDLEAITGALKRAQDEKERPSLVILRTHIGYGAPHRQDTREAHGEPLGEEEVRLTKKFYGWPEDARFLVPEEVYRHMRRAIESGAEYESDWTRRLDAYERAYPELAARLEEAILQKLPDGWDAQLPVFAPSEGPMATRDAGGNALRAIAAKVPWIMGGSGDLSPSTKTLLGEQGYFERGTHANRNLTYGVREHVMCGASSGMYLHGGVRPFAATFFIFTDYARPAMRLAALMELPVIYVMTHDSIGLGEDGPTHQPIEHLASFRAMPNMCVIRPADANEAVFAWRAAMMRKEGPTVIVLTRQKVPVFDRTKAAGAEGLLKGAYVLAKENGAAPQAILIGTGSEVQLALGAKEKLAAEGIDARVVSMPSWEIFRRQTQDYRDSVLPPRVKARLAVEAGSALGWSEWVGDTGDVIAMTTFGASAPAKDNFSHFGFTVENVVERARRLVERHRP